MKKHCCNFDCRQGRDCPGDLEPDSLAVSLACCCICAALIAAPFAAWFLGIAP